MVADKLSPSASVVVIDEKGDIVLLSFTFCPATVPPITGAVFVDGAVIALNVMFKNSILSEFADPPKSAVIITSATLETELASPKIVLAETSELKLKGI